jgi:transcriptional regulator with XRE-family HTH domain
MTDEQIAKKRAQMGATIRTEMERQGLTIADMVKRSGVANQQVQFVRKGHRKYSIDSFLRVWLALKLPMPKP